jgi:hypothetical protein
MDETILNEIAQLLTASFKKQLAIPRQSTRYGSPGIPGAPKRGVSPPIASGRLIRDINVEVVENPQTGFYELQMKMPIEGQFINDGRRPGKYPPIAPIDKWVIQKQAMRGSVRDTEGRFIKRKSLVYLVRRSIGLYGYGGNSFITKGYDEVAPQILELYGEAVAGYVAFEIDNLIDKLRDR